jgi:hypothetical protein
MPFIFRPGGTNRPLLKQIPYYTAFNPRSIGTCSLWLDGNDPNGTGARPSNGTTLTTWVDKSGSGYSTTSGNGVFYSQYQNGNGVVYISASTSMGLPNITTVPVTIFLVGKLVTNAANSFLLALGFNNGSATYLRANYPNSFYGVDSGYQSVGATVSGGRFNIATTNQDSNYHIWSYTQTTNSFFYFDGTEIGSVTTPANSTTTTFTNNTLGGWNNSPNSVASVICEVIFYNSILSTPDRQQIESYLAQKWGLTTTLPSNHLNATRPAGIPAASFINRKGFNLIAALLSGFMSTVYNLSTYSLAAIANSVPSGTPTGPTYIWTVAVPSGAKGKNAILMLFFNLYSLTNFLANQYFDYGIYVDGVAQGFGDTGTSRYIQTALGNYALNNGGITYGTNAMTPYQPLIIPLVLAAGATTIQLGIKNSSAALSYIASVAPDTTNPTAYTSPGQTTYTVPTTSSGVAVTGVYIYAWGSGGGPGGATFPNGTSPAGAGGFAYGFFSCATGTALTVITGGITTGAYNVSYGSGGGGFQGQAAGGGGYSGVFSSTNIVQSNTILIAGGGGGGSVNGYAQCGGGGGGTSGTSWYNPANTTFGGGNDGLGGLSNAIQGSNTGQAALQGGHTYGGGGGGWYGGGVGAFGSEHPGGGGSGYIGGYGSGIGVTSGGVMSNGSTGTTAPISAGTGSNIQAGGSTIMTARGYSPTTYAHGGGGNGLVVIIPAIGTNPVNVGVSAQLYSA